MNLLAAILFAYLLGSISFAVLVSRAFGLPDPYTYGSGNPGATNVLRTGRKAAATLTFLGDALEERKAVLAQACFDARDDGGIVQGVGELVALRCLASRQGDLEIELHRLRHNAFPVVDANQDVEAQVGDENDVHCNR